MDAVSVVVAIGTSPIVLTVGAIVIAFLLRKLFINNPTWKKYEALVIKGVRDAEKAIRDDTPNKSMAKFDHCLKVVLSLYEEVEQQVATDDIVEDLKKAIPIVHSEIEATLKKV